MILRTFLLNIFITNTSDQVGYAGKYSKHYEKFLLIGIFNAEDPLTSLLGFLF